MKEMISLPEFDEQLLALFKVDPETRSHAGRALYRKWNPDLRREILELYARGASDHEVCAELGVTVNTLEKWVSGQIGISNRWEQRAVIDMVKTVYLGRLRSRAFWERQGRMNLDNKDFNAKLWSDNITNRFADWSKRKEERVVVTHDINIDLDEILRKWQEPIEVKAEEVRVIEHKK